MIRAVAGQAVVARTFLRVPLIGCRRTGPLPDST
jgi:hypothetical protein